jgi:hypothetical protein
MDGSVVVTSRRTRFVPVLLFLVGVLITLVLGPLIAPKRWAGWLVVELDVYLGLTLGLALVLGWVVIRLPRQSPPAFRLSAAVVAALFYVVMTATTYGWLVLNYETALAPSPLPATGPGWGLIGILSGFVAALVASLVGGLALAAQGRLRASAIVPGIVVGVGGLILGFKVFENLFHTSIY